LFTAGGKCDRDGEAGLRVHRIGAVEKLIELQAAFQRGDYLDYLPISLLVNTEMQRFHEIQKLISDCPL
jgi:hypothetical protein